MAPKSRRFDLQSTQSAGGSVIDELLTGAPPAPAAVPSAAPVPSASAAPRRAQPGAGANTAQRVSIRVQVPAVLADRVRAAVAALAYQDPEWSSLNAATATTLERFVEDAEAAHHDGRPFPRQPGRQLQPGRRVGY